MPDGKCLDADIYIFEFDRMRKTRKHSVVLACVTVLFEHFAWMKFVFFARKEALSLLCNLLPQDDMLTFGMRSHMTKHGVCLRQPGAAEPRGPGDQLTPTFSGAGSTYGTDPSLFVTCAQSVAIY